MYLQIFTKFLILIIVFNYAYAKLYNNDLFDYVIKNKMVSNGFSIFLIIIALFYLFDRDFFLPFLGPTVMPSVITIPHATKKTDQLININLTELPPKTTVIYWGSSESEKIFEDPVSAYKDYANSGITRTNEYGNVVVQMSCPGTYRVPKFGFLKKLLPRHIHYRYELPYRGLYSKIYTKNIESCDIIKSNS